jgi:hypothetical protein
MEQNGEVAAAFYFAVGLAAALYRPGFILLILPLTVLVLAVNLSHKLSLRLRTRSRDRYYLALPVLFSAFSFAAIQPLRTSPFSVLLLIVLALLYFGLYRSLFARKVHPKSVINLHQNSFLFCSWVCLVIAVIGLFGVFDRSVVQLIITNILIFALVFVLIQSLLFYVRIPPWEYRKESLIGAFGISQFAVIQSLSTINPLIIAGLSFMLFYVFWGVTYHGLKKLLTRTVLYEYLLMGTIGIVFLMIVSRVHISG